MKISASGLSALPIPLLPALAHASEAAVPAPAGSVAQMLLGLVATLALLAGALYLLKRLQGTRAATPGAMRVLGATALGTREKVVLLGVGGKVLVLGVTPGRINTLHTLDAADLPESPAPVPPAAEFASRLRQFMERRGEK
ncbi:MAG: flagellar biosynthetic protein FliO [Candidatus Dactylopiibacterium sp.]|nr:flagellar biosynthetic protein FliO [Candidatus Dactylopiibacterium sp.]